MSDLSEYNWLIGVGILGAIAFGYATGSNDVSNAFATSVGSKTLTMRQAVIIAAVFEFIGGMVLGRVTTNVIANGIADPKTFELEPEIYAYGMCCALGIGALWQLGASYYAYNVSATHTIIGSIIGFAIVYDGLDAVVWAERDPGAFPPYKGVIAIIMSWIVSPVLSGLSAALIFYICRQFVLRHRFAVERAYLVLPTAVFLTTWVNIYFVFTKGAGKTLDKNGNWSDQKSGLVALGCATGLALLSICIVIPYMKKIAAHDKRNNVDITDPDQLETVEHPYEVESTSDVRHSIAVSDVPLTIAQDGEITEDGGAITVGKRNSKWKYYCLKIKAVLLKGTTYDIHEVVKTDPLIAAIHDNAEKFDPRVEVVFSYLQVFSAICVIFAHGSSEVAYMAGPLSGIYQVVTNGEIKKNTDPKIWILLISCLSLVLGLATYGYKVMVSMGVGMCKLSPTRGFAAELSVSLVVMIAAQYGLPTSSSMCITGAIVGIGMLEGVKEGVNWKFVGKQFISWCLTIVVAAGGTGLIFSQGVFSPSVN